MIKRYSQFINESKYNRVPSIDEITDLVLPLLDESENQYCAYLIKMRHDSSEIRYISKETASLINPTEKPTIGYCFTFYCNKLKTDYKHIEDILLNNVLLNISDDFENCSIFYRIKIDSDTPDTSHGKSFIKIWVIDWYNEMALRLSTDTIKYKSAVSISNIKNESIDNTKLDSDIPSEIPSPEEIDDYFQVITDMFGSPEIKLAYKRHYNGRYVTLDLDRDNIINKHELIGYSLNYELKDISYREYPSFSDNMIKFKTELNSILETVSNTIIADYRNMLISYSIKNTTDIRKLNIIIYDDPSFQAGGYLIYDKIENKFVCI